MQLLHSSIFIPLWTHWSRNDIWDTFIQFEIYFGSDWTFSSTFIDQRPRIKILFQIIFSQTHKHFTGRTADGKKDKFLFKNSWKCQIGPLDLIPASFLLFSFFSLFNLVFLLLTTKQQWHKGEVPLSLVSISKATWLATWIPYVQDSSR